MNNEIENFIIYKVEGHHIGFGTISSKNDMGTFFEIGLFGTSDKYYFKKDGTKLINLYVQGETICFTFDEKRRILNTVPNYGGIIKLYATEEKYKDIFLCNTRVNWCEKDRVGFVVKLKKEHYESKLMFAENPVGALEKGDACLMFLEGVYCNNGAWNAKIKAFQRVRQKEKEKDNIVPFQKTG